MLGVCHRGIGTDILGHYVTAKLKNKDDCRQGIVIRTNPLIIRGELGDYECEGTPTAVSIAEYEGYSVTNETQRFV